MAYQPKQLTEQDVYNTLKSFHENQKNSLAVSKVNVPMFQKLMSRSKHLVMNTFPNGSATVIRKTS